LDDGLKKLDKMTNEEARMASAEALKLAHVIDAKVDGVDEKVQGVGEQVKDVDERVQAVSKNVQVVDDSVRAVEEKMQEVLDGAQLVTDLIDTVTDFELSRWKASGNGSQNDHATNGVWCRRCKSFVILSLIRRRSNFQPNDRVAIARWPYKMAIAFRSVYKSQLRIRPSARRDGRVVL
jgi:hypothetical protein